MNQVCKIDRGNAGTVSLKLCCVLVPERLLKMLSAVSPALLMEPPCIGLLARIQTMQGEAR